MSHCVSSESSGCQILSLGRSVPVIWIRAKDAVMSTDKPTGGTSRSELDEYITLGEFWDTHSLADAWDDTEPADLEFTPVLGRRMLVPVDPGLLLCVQRAALTRGLSTESLVNLLLEQRMQQLTVTTSIAA